MVEKKTMAAMEKFTITSSKNIEGAKKRECKRKPKKTHVGKAF